MTLHLHMVCLHSTTTESAVKKKKKDVALSALFI